MRTVKILTLLAALSLLGATAAAQTSSESKFTVAVSVGANDFAGVSAMSGLLPEYETEAQSTNWMNKGLGIGLEAGLLINPSWRLVLGGGFNFTGNPGYPELLGTADVNGTVDSNFGAVPGYKAVASQNTIAYQAYLGFDYLFKIDAVPALRPTVGFKAGGAYASNEQLADGIYSMGRSIAETYYAKAAATLGVEYYFSNSFYIGAQVNALDYTYGMTKYKPQEGLASLKADNHNAGFFAHPVIKVGFVFGK